MSLIRPEHLSPRWREWFEKRAAIIEYDGNMDRATAERLAMDEVLEMMRLESEAAKCKSN